jgi:hypothetical protein
LNEGFLVPDDEAGLKANFDLDEISRDCNATKKQINATFKDVGMAYVEWYRNPSVPMEIEAEVFVGAIGAGDVEKESKDEFQSTSAFRPTPDPTPVNPYSEGTKMMKQMVFVLQTLSNQSQDGLDKMELLIDKVSELVEKISQLTNEAESIIGSNPPEEIGASNSEEYIEETFLPQIKKEKIIWWPYLIILVLVALEFKKELFVHLLSYLLPPINY